MIGGLLGATGAMPNLTNGPNSPISAGPATSGVGDQSQSIGFHGGSVNFGGGGNNQLLIIGALVLAGAYLLTR
ncbi:hypothetical protein [Pseudoalteromonas piscicida]|uniref:hypothetical protein n=1 Tax=Pseudoalteromonas piscicida TaxID=43662 RepID=UPI0030A2316D